jgi:hypothetical protein
VHVPYLSIAAEPGSIGLALLPRHWEYAKDKWIILGLLLGHAASWRGLSGRARARSGSAPIPAPR